jgi:Zn-dependent protease with chaperone function
MNFFDTQERARRKTRYLLFLMTLAVGAVAASVTTVIALTRWLSSSTTMAAPFTNWAWANRELLAAIALAIVGFIGIASLYRVATLRQGGSRVVRDLNGTSVSPDDSDPLRRRLRNVVEEMAIASGVPMPEVFVLDHEPAINAFAAGFRPEDAAVAVTRGTLETLNREELQGVIAHEFSHVLNGDMRLNIRLMGPLFGILSIGLLGRMLLRGNRRSGNRSKGASAALLLGAGLTIAGYAGLLAGRLIKASASRQREYLADASAVQFTRQTSGIAGALKKIAGLSEGSEIESTDAEEISHMLFASGLSSFSLGSLSGALASHPPLFERIHALDPTFTKNKLAKLETYRRELEHQNEGVAGVSGFAAESPAVDIGQTDRGHSKENSEGLLDSIGRPGDEHIIAARRFLKDIPEYLRDTLDSPDRVLLLPPALLLHPDDLVRNKQFALLTQQLGDQRATTVEKIYKDLQTFSYEARLPLLDLALPVIKSQPAGRIAYISELLEQLAICDNRLELFEYSLLRIFQGYMRNAAAPGGRQRWSNLSTQKMTSAAVALITVFARHGNNDDAAAANAIRQGVQILETGQSMPHANAGAKLISDSTWITTADHALRTLSACTPRGRKRVVRALLGTALADGQISQTESELLRAFCMMLDCPMPPILTVRP